MARFLIVLFCLLLPVAAGAADNLRHPELQKFVADGGRVEYLGHAYGLDGWFLEKEGIAPRAAYTTPEGGLVMGLLLDPEGEVVTKTQLMAYRARLSGDQRALPGAEAATAEKPERFYADIERSSWVAVGNPDAPYIYVFMNMHCPHCHDYWKALRPAIVAGALQVRLAPYGTKANRNDGAALLMSDDPLSAFDNFVMSGDRRLLDAAKVDDRAFKAVEANGALLARWKVQSVPFTMYRRLTDGKLAVINGRPGNTMLMMADLVRPEEPAVEEPAPQATPAPTPAPTTEEATTP